MNKEKVLEYLKLEFGIETEDQFYKEYEKFQGLDISLFTKGSEIINDKNKMEKCS